jgi:hypothetical protein
VRPARKRALLVLFAIFAVACGSTQGGGGGTTQLTLPELKYRVIAKAGTPAYCGPPVARQGWEQQQAAADFPAIKADAETYQAILAHAHPAGDESSADYQLAVWREWKQLQAVRMTQSGSGYDFEVFTGHSLVQGTVDATGNVAIASTKPAAINCPICLAAATLIDTPRGQVRVTDLRLGDPVWTVLADGSREASVVTALGSVPFPFGHDAVQLRLADGRTVTASAGHPTAAGTAIGNLRPGDRLDGSTVVSATTVRLNDGATYDFLPSGPTGDYWANGILLGSTLNR